MSSLHHIYIFILCFRPQHKKIFTCNVKINLTTTFLYNETGRGSSKKNAKRQAALKLIKKLSKGNLELTKIEKQENSNEE